MSIASVFRGMIYWGSAGVTATADRDLDPVKLVTPANVIGGIINWGGGSLKARHTVAIVTWYDLDDFCRPAYEVVEGTPADIARFGYRTMEYVAIGCTSLGQAYRMGRWAIETEKSEAETCSWQAAWDHADVYPGEIVSIQDPSYAGVQFGGRVTALVTTVGVTGVNIDRPVTLEVGKNYTLNVTLSNGEIAVRPLTNVAGVTTVFNFAVALTPDPIVNAIWVLTASDLAPRKVKIVKRVETSAGLFDLSGILHDDTKFARIEQDYRITPTPYTSLPTGAILPPSDLLADENLLVIGSNVRSQIILSWKLSPDPRVVNYEVQIKPPDLNWQPSSPQFTSETSIDLLDIVEGTWGFRVRAMDAFARNSIWITIEAFEVVGMSLPPDDVQNVRGVAYVDDNTSIAWDEIQDVRPIRYAVRKGDNWNAALELGTIAHPPFATHGEGQYLIKAYTGPDSGRVYSVNASTLIIEGSTLERNVVATWDEMATGWTGIYTGTVAKSGSLIRTGGSGSLLTEPDFLGLPDMLNLGGQGNGTYEIPSSHYINAGRVAPCRVTCTWKGTSQISNDDFLNNPDILNNPDFLASGSGELVEVYPEVSVSQYATGTDVFNLDPFLNPANDIFAESDVFSDDISFGPWVKYEPGIYVGARYRARLVLKTRDPQVIAIALEFKFTVDVPDRVDTWALVGGVGTSLNRITVPSTGLALVFASNGRTVAEPFNGGPNVDLLPLIQITNTSSNAFDFEVTGLTLAGCTIIPRLAGTPTDAPLTNITIQGW